MTNIVYPTAAERDERAEALWHEFHGENAHHCAGKPKWSGYQAGFCGRQVKAEGDFCYAHRSQAPVPAGDVPGSFDKLRMSGVQQQEEPYA